MNITRKLNGNEMEIALEGRLDTMTAPQLEAELNWTTSLLPGCASCWPPIRSCAARAA